jgi:plasmid stabilization system protein ParE
MLAYEFTERAAQDFDAAVEWYKRQRTELGRAVVDSIVQAIDIARSRPMSCPEIEAGVRGVRCVRFPYRIHFEVLPDRVRLLAIYHTSRNPERWDDSDRD